jgi:hypothetical protein
LKTSCTNIEVKETQTKRCGFTRGGSAERQVPFGFKSPLRFPKYLRLPSLYVAQLQQPSSGEGSEVVRDHLGGSRSIILMIMTTRLMSTLNKGRDVSET